MIVLKTILIAGLGILLGGFLTVVIFTIELQKEIERIERDAHNLNEQNTIHDTLL